MALRILLIDDNPNDRLLATRSLTRAFTALEVKTVTNASEFDRALETGDFDATITDYQLLWTDGLAVLKAIKARYPDCPVVMFTDSGSEEVAVAGMKAGLSDYVLKGRQLHRLPIAVRESIEKQRLQQQYAIAVEQLAASEERLRLALSAAQMVTWDWNLVTQQVIWSENYESLFGLEIDSLSTSEAVLSCIYSEDYEAVVSAIAVALQGKTEYSQEFRVLWPDGSLHWLAAQGKLFYDANSQPIRMIGVAWDITDRKQALEAVRQSEEDLRFATEAANIVAFSWNLKTGQVRCSQNANEVTGLGPDAATDTFEQVLKDIHPEDRGHFQANIEVALSGQVPYESEYRRVLPDGSIRWLLDKGRVRFSKSGQPLQLFGITVDITNRKQVEAEQVRLLELEQTARAAAESANRIKDEFLATLSHELRSPLNAILGWAQMLRSHRFDEATAVRALETIERNARLQNQLIEDLLDISRIIQGKLTLKIVPLNLITPMEAAIETLRLAAQAKSIQMEVILDSSVGTVNGDVNRLQQVVWNLLSNAIKFTPSGGLVRVLLERVESMAQIVVSDTGMGIHPNFLPYVFESFRQADASITRNHGGLGLGLAIVRHLVELHGGTIQAASAGEGKGATFTVQLPLSGHQPSVMGEPNRLTSIQLDGIKVLVVDDEPDSREFLAFVLEGSGAKVMEVGSATEALEALKVFKPDILLSDIGMPEEDGYTFLRKVRTLPSESVRQIPAIALTAYARAEDRSLARAAGFQRHLSKPIEAEQLLRAIATLVTETRAQ